MDSSVRCPSRLAGLITDGDLRRTLKLHGPQEWAKIAASQIATPDPITIHPHEPAIAALQLMERNRRMAISVLPVISASERGFFVGLLRLHDLIRAGFSISISPSEQDHP